MTDLTTRCGDGCTYKNGCKCAHNGIAYPLDHDLLVRLGLHRSTIRHGIYWVLENYGPTQRSHIMRRLPGWGHFALDSALKQMRDKGLIESRRGVWRINRHEGVHMARVSCPSCGVQIDMRVST